MIYRVSVCGAIKQGKDESSIELLGCSIKYLKEWLQSHFLPGMTWDNWGKKDDNWHIDHHYPIASFDLADPEQRKQCFHYTNMYPMWGKDNLSKHNTIPDKPRENPGNTPICRYICMGLRMMYRMGRVGLLADIANLSLLN